MVANQYLVTSVEQIAQARLKITRQCKKRFRTAQKNLSLTDGRRGESFFADFVLRHALRFQAWFDNWLHLTSTGGVKFAFAHLTF